MTNFCDRIRAMTYDDETIKLMRLVASKAPLNRKHRSAIVERIDDYLMEAGEQVSRPYRNIASHLMKWLALPHKRSNSWRKTVRNGRVDIRHAIANGGALAAYAEGHGKWRGRRIDPAEIYAQALDDCVDAYLEAHPTADSRKVRLMFQTAVPHPMSLHDLMTLPMPVADMPPSETGDYEEL